jgi:hypothetical protein
MPVAGTPPSPMPEELTSAERLERLASFRELLEQRGLRVAPTRVGQYLKALSRFATLAQVPDTIETRAGLNHDEFDQYLFVLREVDELLWVFKGLQVREPAGALDKIEKALGGQMLSREDLNSTARNYLFELRIASYFLQAGLEVDMSDDADVMVRLDTAAVHIECKRPESRAKVLTRAKEALRQLQRRFEQDGDARSLGLVAIDVGRILHPGQGLSFGVTAESMRDGLRAQLLKFDDEYQLAKVFRGEKRVLSVWLQLLTPVLHMTEGQPATRFSSLHLPLVPEFGERARVFEKLRSAFELP